MLLPSSLRFSAHFFLGPVCLALRMGVGGWRAVSFSLPIASWGRPPPNKLPLDVPSESRSQGPGRTLAHFYKIIGDWRSVLKTPNQELPLLLYLHGDHIMPPVYSSWTSSLHTTWPLATPHLGPHLPNTSAAINDPQLAFCPFLVLSSNIIRLVLVNM